MNGQQPPLPDDERLREEAAHWFACMRGPDEAARRSEFEAWLARSAHHRAAYSRIAETFSLGKGLASDIPYVGPKQPFRWKPAAAVAGALAAVGVAFLGIHQTLRPYEAERAAPVVAMGDNQPGSRPTQLATRIGEIRSFRLADNSTVTLDTDSSVIVSLGKTMRFLRLDRGRARFDVAHEARPFVVGAAGGTVTAHGTLFDVGIGPAGTVKVRLLRGRIDVALAPSGHSPSPVVAKVQHLQPGQQVSYLAGMLTTAQSAPGANDQWPEAIGDFDGAPLADVIAQANRYSSIHLVLGTPDLAALRVSGRFRINAPEKLAAQFALLFDLSLEPNGLGDLVLNRRSVRLVSPSAR